MSELEEQSSDWHGEEMGEAGSKFKEEAGGKHSSKGLRRRGTLAARGRSTPQRVRAAGCTPGAAGRPWGHEMVVRGAGRSD